MNFEEALEATAYADQIHDLRKALDHARRDLLKAKDRTQLLVDATHEAAYDAMIALGPFQPAQRMTRDRRKAKGEVALWHMTDWQGSKVTTTYNSDIMRERVMRFCKKAVHITDIQRADHPVRDCVIAFSGDMIEGLFNFPTQGFEIDHTLHDQMSIVTRLLIDVVEVALANYEHVTVVSEWGNHGRIGSKRDAVPKSDNFDRMCYTNARMFLHMLYPKGNRLIWDDCPEDIQRIEIGNYRALLMHGDEVGRAGFASPSAWQAAGNRWKAGAYGWHFQDIYLGHYHRHAQEPLSDGLGAIYWTGSTESDNRYARDSLAASGVPSQRLHFVDPERGRVTSQYQIWLGE